MLLRAWFGLLGIDLLLRGKGYESIRRSTLFRPRSDAAGADRPTPAEMERLFHLVAIAGRHHLYPMLCLRRALTLQWLLARRGLATEMRLGVARGETGIEAHAWLEFEGAVVGDSRQEIARYQRLEEGGRLP